MNKPSESVLIAGGSGIVGSELKKKLSPHYQVFILSRSQQGKEGYYYWDHKNSKIDSNALEVDHVINLTGAGIADKRWTAKRKKEILTSRIDSTNFLISRFKIANKKLKSFIGASAIGYYGNTGDQLMSEHDLPVTDEFLSDVCVQWEAATKPASEIADQTSIVRIGTVLTLAGGALEPITKSLKLGMANYFGNGKQHMSWIHIDDLCGILFHLLKAANGNETYNAVAPQIVTNKTFAKALKKAYNGFTIVAPAPAIALKLALGEMSSLVLNSSKISAQKIVDSGYKFKFDTIEKALLDIY